VFDMPVYPSTLWCMGNSRVFTSWPCYFKLVNKFDSRTLGTLWWCNL